MSFAPNELHRRASELFLRVRGATDSLSLAELERECAGAPEVLAEVRSLLEAEARGRNILEQRPDPTGVAGATSQHVGRYRLLEVLGSGGMGVVYLAEQDHPRRIVALKLLHPGLAAGPARARFEREIETLARLHHPHIAHILDAGEWHDGLLVQPYYAMEWVRGATLREHCDAHKLSDRARLSLVADLARAAHYAHTCGVVHRDLKPLNVIVDEVGQPKILDFGIARVLATDTAAAVTETRESLGTPAYMAPEQFERGALIDARADVFALGVIAYELVERRLPIDPRGASVAQFADDVRGREPSALRAVERELRTDLQVVLARALAKEPGQRYASAAEFADDLDHVLAARPIAARAPSRWYRTRRFVRRHRTATIGAAATLSALALGLAGTTWKAVEAADQRDQARLALEATEKALSRDRTSLEFMLGMITSIAPTSKRPAKTSVAVLDRMAERLEQPLGLAPEQEQRLRHIVGYAYNSLGSPAQAEPHLARAFDLAREHAAVAALERIAAGRDLAYVWMEQQRFELVEALLRDVSDDAGRTAPALLARVVLTMAEARFSQGDWLAAAHGCRAALALHAEGATLPDGDVVNAWTTLGRSELRQGEVECAAPCLATGLALAECTLDERDSDRLLAAAGLADGLKALGRIEDARAVVERALPLCIDVFGEDHWCTLGLRLNELDIARSDGRLEESLEIAARVIASDGKARHGPGEMGREASIARCVVFALQSDFSAAADEYESWVRRTDGNLTSIDRERWEEALGHLAGLVTRTDQHATSARALTHLLDLHTQARGFEGESTLLVAYQLARALKGSGRVQEALERFRVVRERLACTSSPTQTMTETCDLMIGHSLMELGRFEESEVVLWPCHEAWMSKAGPAAQGTANAELALDSLYEHWPAGRAREWRERPRNP